MSPTPTIAARVLPILAEEMGPAGEDFLVDACVSRFGMSPEDLTAGDLPALADAIRAEVAAVLGERTATKLADRIRALSG